MICVNLVSLDLVATSLKYVMYIKNVPSILGWVKKKCGREHCLKEELRNVIASVVQRASIEFRQLLLIISSPRK